MWELKIRKGGHRHRPGNGGKYKNIRTKNRPRFGARRFSTRKMRIQSPEKGGRYESRPQIGTEVNFYGEHTGLGWGRDIVGDRELEKTKDKGYFEENLRKRIKGGNISTEMNG